MKVDILGRAYIAIMALYFVGSGFLALSDIDAKLARISLSAVDDDGKIAFILIYCSLMVGIGVAIGLLYYLSHTWKYSAVLAVTIICSFISFRLVGSVMLGQLSSVQIGFIAVELIEVGLGVLLLVKSRKLKGDG